MHLADPRFPPLLTGHPVKRPDCPLPVACARAAEGALGAGDIVWARGASAAEAAIVLEPDVSWGRAREMALVVQSAIIDALGMVMPSQTAVQIAWPDAIVCNGAQVGRTCLVAPAGLASEQVPDWMVVAFRIALTRDLDGLEPGLVRTETSLNEEDGGDLTRTDVLEAVAAHLNSTIHDWESDGLRAIANRWIGRVLGYGEPWSFPVASAPNARHEGHPDDTSIVTGGVVGQCLGLTDDLDLIVRADDGALHHLPWPLDTYPLAPTHPLTS